VGTPHVQDADALTISKGNATDIVDAGEAEQMEIVSADCLMGRSAWAPAAAVPAESRTVL
jgi:hypothetical protein